jgi:hypothetical protein
LLITPPPVVVATPATPTQLPPNSVATAVATVAIPTVESTGRAVPILGGTLTVASSGVALVVDPDRDRLFIVDVANAALLHEVAFSDGDEPGRLIEDASGTAWVVMRRGGAVVQVDLEGGDILRRVDVCAEPRGVAFDTERSAIVVSCAGGELVRVEADTTLTTLVLARDDLRDIVVEPPYYLVSRFESSELLIVNPVTGAVHDHLAPHGWNDPTLGDLAPTTAFKMNRIDGGRVMVQHQRANRSALVPVYYGPVGCAPGIVHSMVSVIDAPDYASTEVVASPSRPLDAAVDGGTEVATPSNYVPSSRNILRFAAPSVERVTDFAVDADAKIYIAITNAGPTSEYRSGVFQEIADGNCDEELPAANTLQGQASAVAFANDGTPLIQTREPAALHILRSDGAVQVTLSDDARGNTGHYLFHARTASGLACTSCHPEGGDDGNVWNFVGLGQRRTQPLWGGITQTAPFHWLGEHADLDALLTDTLQSRMRGISEVTLPDDVGPRLGRWLDTLPTPRGSAIAAEAVSAGRTAFEKAECNTCHAGFAFTDNQSHDVGTGGRFQTSSLLGLRFRGPYLHNGCAKTLEERFTACGGTAHGKPDLLDETEMSALLVYLRAL